MSKRSNMEVESQDAKTVPEVDIVSLEVDWVNEIVFYNVRVKIPEDEEVAYAMKRYSQFRELNKALKEEMSRFSFPPLPPKEMIIWTDHTDTRFVEERRALLEYYLREVLKHEEIRTSQMVHDFLHSNGIPANVAKSVEAEHERNQNVDFMHVDEMEVTDIWIPNTKKMRDHCLYQIHCTNGSAGDRSEWNEWVVLKRYRDFHEMDNSLREELPPAVLKDLPQLPERQSKIFMDHLDPDFIDQRRVLLQNYMQKLLRVPDLQHCNSFLKFLNVAAI